MENSILSKRMKISEPLKGRALVAAEKLVSSGDNFVEVADSQGMLLIKGDTPELENRRATNGVILSTLNYKGQEFFLCAS